MRRGDALFFERPKLSLQLQVLGPVRRFSAVRDLMLSAVLGLMLSAVLGLSPKGKDSDRVGLGPVPSKSANMEKWDLNCGDGDRVSKGGPDFFLDRGDGDDGT